MSKSSSKNLSNENIQVNLFQKPLFLPQLTYNMTKDCSWNYHENYRRRKLAEHILPMFCPCSFHGNSMNNLLSYCALIDAKIRASDKDLPVHTPCFQGIGILINVLSWWQQKQHWLFLLLRFFDELFDVIIDNPFLNIFKQRVQPWNSLSSNVFVVNTY